MPTRSDTSSGPTPRRGLLGLDADRAAILEAHGLIASDETLLSGIVERMRKDIKLELKSVEQKENRGGATIAFALSYDGRNPQTVARVTNTLASFYIEENLKLRERQSTGAADFLTVQRGETRKRLDELEARVGDFKRRYLGELPGDMQGKCGGGHSVRLVREGPGGRRQHRPGALLHRGAGEAGAARARRPR